MRLRSTLAVAATAAGLLTAPFAVAADAVTTTSTIVAYTADVDGNGNDELYTRPADGSGSATKLFTTAYDISLPALSPDGTKIAYLQTDAPTAGDGTYRLYVRTVSPVGSPVLVLNKSVTASVGWSPDGTKIVARAYNADYSFGTYIAMADGTGTPTLVPTTNTIYSEEPSFAPSGTQVALDAFDADYDYAGIDLITLSTGKRARIAGTSAFGASDPVWSPDGQYVLFQKWLPTCGIGLYRVPAGGGTPVTIRAVTNRFLGSAEYSRDGSQLFWGESPMADCGTTTPKGEIWVGNADGTSATQVVVTPTVGEKTTTVAGGTPLTPDATPPAAPVIGAVGVVAATSATVSWTADPDATDFVLLRKASGDAAPTSSTDGVVAYHGPAHSATATGLTTGTAYDLYVWAFDATGNAATSPSLVHSVRPYAAPVITPRGLVSSLSLNTTFPVKWTATAPTYQLDVGEKTKNPTTGYWSNSPAYTVLKAATAGTGVSFTGTQGHTYYFRVRGRDGLGNVTAYSATTAYVPLNENASGVLYSAGWTASAGSTRWLGTFRGATTASRVISAKFDTSSFTIVGDRCPSCGQFKVYVDGIYKGTVDSYGSTTTTRRVLWTGTRFLSGVKSHTLKIVTVGTAGRPRVDIDAIGLTR
jgi:Tol biopolymer transport system component